jgi:hypothetical protein
MLRGKAILSMQGRRQTGVGVACRAVRQLVVRNVELHPDVDGDVPVCWAISTAQIDDGLAIITAESPGIVRWWDGHTGTEKMVLSRDAGTVHDVAVMAAGPVGPVAISAGLQGVRFWELTTGAAIELREAAGANVLTAAHVVRTRHDRPEGLILADGVGGVECWAMARLLRWRLPVAPRNGPVFAVAGLQLDRRLSVAAHAEGVLLLIDGVWGRVIGEYRVGGEATSYSMAVLYGDQVPYIALAIEQHVHLIDARNGNELYRWFVGSSELRRVAILESDGGPLIATLSEDGLVGVCTPKGEFVAAYELPTAASALAPVARNVLAAGYIGGWSLLKMT